MRLIVTAVAEDQIREAQEWWRLNRTDSPDLLVVELSKAFQLITQHPLAGPTATNLALSLVRRVLPERTSYYLYYCLTDDEIQVLALWHMRRSGPELVQ